MSDAIHTFHPWARRGLARQIQAPEKFGSPGINDDDVRAKFDVHVHIKVNGSTGTTGSPVTLPLHIIGPGDVIGIHQDVVIKTEPNSWITNFEPHNFPYIDFYEEDFPWRYTPAKATAATATSGGKLTPWIALVVLKDDEFTRVTVDNAPLPALELAPNFFVTDPGKRPFPDFDTLSAWAHVSVDKMLATANSNLDAKIADLNASLLANPNIAISRMLCPRKLEPNTSYHAFLIPTYETGRRAGLGLTLPGNLKAQTAAWDHTTMWTGQNLPPEAGKFPIYYEWYFRTGATGDFEYLVRQLKPRVADLRVGKRKIDISSPGYGITYTPGTPGVDKGTENMEGALRIPNTALPQFTNFKPITPPPSPVPPPTPQQVLRDKIKDFVNLGEDMLVVPGAFNSFYDNVSLPKFPDAIEDQSLFIDPIVAPPLYGRWHTLRGRVDPTDGALDWLNELNLDPRYRIAAGLGAEYVKNRQEYLMQLAWAQVGPIIEANTAARLAQLAAATAEALHKRHLAQQPLRVIIPMTDRVQSKIKSGTKTMEQAALDSSLPNSAPSSAFRKMTGPGGSVTKRSGSTINTIANNVMDKMRIGNVKPVEIKAPPGYSAATMPLSTLTNTVSKIQNVNAAAMTFSITAPGASPGAPSNVVAASFKTAIAPYGNVFDVANWPTAVWGSDLTPATSAIADSIDPRVTHPKSFYSGVYFVTQPPVADVIVEAMTHPSFHLPMYEAVRDLGIDYLIPNLNLLPQNSVTLFESNQKFIEAFMVGANYEMGRELLWREYPTDQRGTYFRHFWGGKDSGDPEMNTRDITDIYLWSSMSALGDHNGRTGGKKNPLVLSIRGDFLKKFPNAVVYAIRAEWADSAQGFEDRPRKMVKITAANPGDMKFPTFNANVNPDVTFLGFDLDKDQAKGNRHPVSPQVLDPGWFIVFQERPGELRFGLDFTSANLDTWNDLSWGDVQVNGADYLKLIAAPTLSGADPNGKRFAPETSRDVEWAADSGAMAMILYQNPVKLAIHCYEMIP